MANWRPTAAKPRGLPLPHLEPAEIAPRDRAEEAGGQATGGLCGDRARSSRGSTCTPTRPSDFSSSVTFPTASSATRCSPIWTECTTSCACCTGSIPPTAFGTARPSSIPSPAKRSIGGSKQCAQRCALTRVCRPTAPATRIPTARSRFRATSATTFVTSPPCWSTRPRMVSTISTGPSAVCRAGSTRGPPSGSQIGGWRQPRNPRQGGQSHRADATHAQPRGRFLHQRAHPVVAIRRRFRDHQFPRDLRRRTRRPASPAGGARTASPRPRARIAGSSTPSRTARPGKKPSRRSTR